MNKLNALRDHVDELDLEISLLLEKRQNTVDLIGKIKQQEEISVTDVAREADVLQKVEEAVQHPLLKESIGSIYKMIMDNSKIAQRLFSQPTCPFSRIGVVGLGLMGGSIFKALKLKNPSQTIFSSEKVEDLVSGCDLIILATPISTIEALSLRIAACQTPVIVIDIASVKGRVVDCFERLSQNGIEFVGTHPMSGTEKRGFANSQATMFVGNPWVVTPHKNNTEGTLERVEAFIRYLGSDPVVLDAAVHDSQAALISHVPGLLARSFLAFVRASDPESLTISGPGFRSFTRLAHDNGEMMAEMIATNRKNIQNLLKQWRHYEAHQAVSNGLDPVDDT